MLGALSDYGVFQLEVGREEATPHFEGYLHFDHARAFKTIKSYLPKAHIEKARGTALQNQHYCCKPIVNCECEHCKDCPDRLMGPWEWGELPRQGKRSDIAEAIELLRTEGIGAVIRERPEVVVKYPAGLKFMISELDYQTPRDSEGFHVSLYLGASGVGKSLAVRQDTPFLDRWVNPAYSTWFDGYRGQTVLAIDDFDGRASRMPLQQLLTFLDPYDLRLDVKTNHVMMRAKHVILTSNLHPYTWYDWTHRGQQYWALLRRFDEIVIFDAKFERHVLTPAELRAFAGGSYGPMPDYNIYDWYPRPISDTPVDLGPIPASLIAKWKLE